MDFALARAPFARGARPRRAPYLSRNDAAGLWSARPPVPQLRERARRKLTTNSALTEW